MDCPSCRKDVTPDSFFCVWCSTFIPLIEKGKKANLFARWLATTIDPLIGLLLYFFAIVVVAAMSEELGLIMAILFPVAYVIVFLVMLSKGQTPGKKLLGLQVVNAQTGAIPGFGTMFLREVIGRFLSGLFFGLGYFWALFDKNAQAWHDKLAGTVVLKVAR